MKIAICISGLCRGNVAENLERMKQHFPYDYFFGTWEGREKEIESLLPGEKYITTPEPHMHYHPVMNANKNIFKNNKNKEIIDGRVNRVAQKCRKNPQLKPSYNNKTKQHLG